MLYLIVYLYDFYGNFINILKDGFGIGIGAILILAIVVATHWDERNYEGESRDRLDYREVYWSARKRLGQVFKIVGVLGLVIMLLPSPKGLAMLGGVYVGSQVYDKMEHSTLVDKSIKILDNELNKYLDAQLAPDEPKDAKDSKESK